MSAPCDGPFRARVPVPAHPAVIRLPVPGPVGQQGPPGLGSAVTHAQTVPAATWIIPHTLGRPPFVAVYDAEGAEMIADVFASPTTVTVIFAQATAGSAILI